MGFKKSVIIATLIAVTVTASAFLFPLIPCKIAPSVPNPVAAWQMCNLSEAQNLTFTSTTLYFGLIAEKSTTALLTLASIFAVSLGHMNLRKRQKERYHVKK